MKKLLILLTVLVLAFSLSACGKDEKVTLDLDAIGKEIAGGNLFLDTQLQPLKSESIAGIVGIDTSACVASTYYMGAAATAEEWGLFECNSAKDAEALVTQLKAHRDELKDTYSSYAPDAMPRLDNAVIQSKGQYVIFISAENYTDAQKIADSYFA